MRQQHHQRIRPVEHLLGSVHPVADPAASARHHLPVWVQVLTGSARGRPPAGRLQLISGADHKVRPFFSRHMNSAPASTTPSRPDRRRTPAARTAPAAPLCRGARGGAGRAAGVPGGAGGAAVPGHRAALSGTDPRRLARRSRRSSSTIRASAVCMRNAVAASSSCARHRRRSSPFCGPSTSTTRCRAAGRCSRVSTAWRATGQNAATAAQSRRDPAQPAAGGGAGDRAVRGRGPGGGRGAGTRLSPQARRSYRGDATSGPHRYCAQGVFRRPGAARGAARAGARLPGGAPGIRLRAGGAAPLPGGTGATRSAAAR